MKKSPEYNIKKIRAKLHGIEAQEAIHILCEYLLGEDYYIVDPVGPKQANAIIIDDILRKYSKRFKKELKELEYEKAHPNGREIRIFGHIINIKKEKRE